MQDLSDSELEVMKILWDKGEGTVRDVLEGLRPKKDLAFNTVMTFLVRMHKKGYLSRKKQGGIYIYNPKVTKSRTLTEIVDKIINKVLDGSLDPLVTYIAESRNLSPEQIQKLKKIVGDSTKNK